MASSGERTSAPPGPAVLAARATAGLRERATAGVGVVRASVRPEAAGLLPAPPRRAAAAARHGRPRAGAG